MQTEIFVDVIFLVASTRKLFNRGGEGQGGFTVCLLLFLEKAGVAGE